MKVFVTFFLQCFNLEGLLNLSR
uniref:Uncharacterized protein n=1 Tax=Rhizophora mucronata TaxID=61149 RepID=A0A2P2MX79_RHIMU